MMAVSGVVVILAAIIWQGEAYVCHYCQSNSQCAPVLEKCNYVSKGYNGGYGNDEYYEEKRVEGSYLPMKIINTEECMMQAFGIVSNRQASRYGWRPDHTENTCQPTPAGLAVYLSFYVFFFIGLLYCCCVLPFRRCCKRICMRKRGAASSSGEITAKEVVVVKA